MLSPGSIDIPEKLGSLTTSYYDTGASALALIRLHGIRSVLSRDGDTFSDLPPSETWIKEGAFATE